MQPWTSFRQPYSLALPRISKRFRLSPASSLLAQQLPQQYQQQQQLRTDLPGEIQDMLQTKAELQEPRRLTNVVLQLAAAAAGRRPPQYHVRKILQRDPRVRRLLERCVGEQGSQLDGFQAASVIELMAVLRLQHTCRNQLAVVETWVGDHLPSLEARYLAALLKAFVSLDPRRPVVTSLLAEAGSRLRDFTPGELVGLVQCCAEVRDLDVDVTSALLQLLSEHMWQLGHGDLALLATAVSRLAPQHRPDGTKFYDALARQALQLVRDFPSNALADLAWSLAKLQKRPGVCYSEAVGDPMAAARSTKAAQAMLENPYVPAPGHDRTCPLINALAAEVVRRVRNPETPEMPEMPLTVLVRMTWALSALRILHHPLWQATIAYVLPRTAKLHLHDVSLLFHAATAVHPMVPAMPQLMSALLEQVAVQQAHMADDSLLLVAWSMVVQQLDHAKIMSCARARILQLARQRKFTHELACMSYQLGLHWDLQQDASKTLPLAVMEQCRHAFAQSPHSESSWQRAFSRSLRQACRERRIFPVKSEYTVHGGYRVDVALPNQVAVEFYGPQHFLWGLRQPLGTTLLRERQLRNLGWRLKTVSFRDWGPLYTEDDRRDFVVANVLHDD